MGSDAHPAPPQHRRAGHRPAGAQHEQPQTQRRQGHVQLLDQQVIQHHCETPLYCRLIHCSSFGSGTMKLTQYSDYSLRVLIYLGLRGEALSTISAISESYGISRNHIVKVVHQLGQLGYVETLRGKNGGLRLAHRPEDINVGEVVRYTEANMSLVECFGDQNACVLTPNCVLRGALNE